MDKKYTMLLFFIILIIALMVLLYFVEQLRAEARAEVIEKIREDSHFRTLSMQKQLFGYEEKWDLSKRYAVWHRRRFGDDDYV